MWRRATCPSITWSRWETGDAVGATVFCFSGDGSSHRHVFVQVMAILTTFLPCYSRSFSYPIQGKRVNISRCVARSYHGNLCFRFNGSLDLAFGRPSIVTYSVFSSPGVPFGRLLLLQTVCQTLA
jgi:hypothetical protein